MEITISIDSVIAIACARAALDHANSTSETLPDILCPDRREAMHRSVIAAFGDTTAQLLPHITSAHIPDDADDDTLSIEIPDADRLPPGAPTLLRRQIENMLAMNVLEAIYIADASPAAPRYAALAADAAADTASLLASCPHTPAGISPWRL